MALPLYSGSCLTLYSLKLDIHSTGPTISMNLSRMTARASRCYFIPLDHEHSHINSYYYSHLYYISIYLFIYLYNFIFIILLGKQIQTNQPKLLINGYALILHLCLNHHHNQFFLNSDHFILFTYYYLGQIYLHLKNTNKIYF